MGSAALRKTKTGTFSLKLPTIQRTSGRQKKIKKENYTKNHCTFSLYYQILIEILITFCLLEYELNY